MDVKLCCICRWSAGIEAQMAGGVMVPAGRKLPVFWDSFPHILAKKPVPSSMACQTRAKPPEFEPLSGDSVITLWSHNMFIFPFPVFSFS